MFLFILTVLMGLHSPKTVEHNLVMLNPDSIVAVQDSLASRKHVKIGKILIFGNNKTKEKIILRELSVQEGQVYDAQELEAVLETDKNKIFNTRLFNTVEIDTLAQGHGFINIVIRVSERWYLFPVPIFDLVDRNFNDWWVNQNRDLSRVNYGLNLYKENARGRNERLRLTAQFGFTQKFEISYSIPYIDNAQKHGLAIKARYSENKNIAFRTVDHRQRFLDSEDVLLLRRSVGFTYTYRKSFYEFHNFEVNFDSNEIADTINFLNPEFFRSDRLKQRRFSLSYSYVKEKRDYNAYPLNGFIYAITLNKNGIGIYDDINMLDINAFYAKYFDLNKGFYLSNYTQGYISLPENQPYANFDGLGYGRDFVRGYELYLIEGQSYALNKTTFKKKILSGKAVLKPIPVKEFRTVPYAIYLKTYADFGYVNNFNEYEENNRLSNRYLFGTGVGLDIVTFYDLVFRFEYSVNREKESGFFVHFRKEF